MSMPTAAVPGACDPVKQTGCQQAAEACYGYPQGAWQCLLPGPGGEGTSSVSPSDCSEGIGCFAGPDGQACRPYCDPAAPSCTSRYPFARWSRFALGHLHGPRPDGRRAAAADHVRSGQPDRCAQPGRLLRLQRHNDLACLLPGALSMFSPAACTPTAARDGLLRRLQRPAVPPVLQLASGGMPRPGAGLHEHRPQRLRRLRRRRAPPDGGTSECPSSYDAEHD